MRTARLVFKYVLVAFFVGGGIYHFFNADFYLNIMPEFLPLHSELVFLSGVTEIVAGLMLATPRISKWGAWFIIAHLLVFFIVHIDMIVHADRFPEIPLAALYLRIPIQFVLIGWAYWFTRGAVPLLVANSNE